MWGGQGVLQAPHLVACRGLPLSSTFLSNRVAQAQPRATRVSNVAGQILLIECKDEGLRLVIQVICCQVRHFCVCI